MALDPADILTGLAKIITEETGIPAEQISAEQSFVDDLDIDSLSMMTIITLAEDEFSVKIPDDVTPSLITVGDAVNFIAKAAN
ncbi:MAG: acyl carrier protein [Bifidobacteriaceae bacterium]|jgi:acyl carrier protein|nr:acyl carrier protein [Bifidobacteriaceae bacterium]